MAENRGLLVASVALLIFTLSLSLPQNVHPQIRILSHRTTPDPPVLGMSHWILVDFEKGPVAKIHFHVTTMGSNGQRRVVRNSFPPPRPFEGVESGTLTLFDLPREEPGMGPERFLTVQLEDRNGNKTEPLELVVVPTQTWEATSPVKLLEATSETAAPRTDGEKNWLRISFEKDAVVRPELLYMEWESERHRGLQEMKFLEKVVASGEARCWWTAVGHGERTFRFWLVDERGDQSNYVETKISF
jgi:hypothetical protein